MVWSVLNYWPSRSLVVGRYLVGYRRILAKYLSFASVGLAHLSTPVSEVRDVRHLEFASGDSAMMKGRGGYQTLLEENQVETISFWSGLVN